ncbi:MAG: 3-dehydroquinate synthase family protein [Bacilli bacterium]
MKITYLNQQVDIVYTNNLLKDFNYDNKHKYLVITDNNVYSFYEKIINEISNDVLVFKAEESSKSYDSTLKIINFLLDNNYQKSDYLIAFGGGMIGDLTGFVASIFKRGIKYISIPTTLISQIDSAIGGKNGVNHRGFKNQIGTIYHPHKIFIDANFLKTLPKIEYTSGMGEVIKYATLFSSDMFVSLEAGSFQLDIIIKECVNIKINITTQDEFDLGLRRSLNFGHTIGHAIESKYKLPHGIAIGYGMYYESKNERLKALLEKYGWDFSKGHNEYKDYLLQDKKISDGKITKIDLIDIGKFEIREVTIDEFL